MVDVNQPVTNPKLVTKIQQFQKTNAQDDWNAVVSELLQANFLCPVIMEVDQQPDEQGSITLKQDTKIQIPMITSQKEEQYFMAFTDWSELYHWKQEEHQQTIVLRFHDYLDMVLSNTDAYGCVIDAYGVNLVLSKEWLRNLKEQMEIQEHGKTNHHMDAGEQISLGDPAEPPVELMHALKSAAKKQKQISALYLQLMVHGNEKSWLIIADIEGERKPLFDWIADIARPYLNGMYLDLITATDSLGLETIQSIEPFYKKLFYQKPKLLGASAEIQDTFAMKDGSCVLGCHIDTGEFSVGDHVEVLDAQSQCMFSCEIAAMEQPTGQVKTASSKQQGRYGANFGILIKGIHKDAFQGAKRLKK